MDPEEPPFENPLEKEYNRLLEELASQKLDCEAQISKITQEMGCAGGGNHPDGDHGPKGDREVPETSTGSSGGSVTGSDGSGSNHTSSTGFVGHSTNSSHPITGSGRDKDTSFFSGGATNHTSLRNNTVSGHHFVDDLFNNSSVGDGCPPCPILHEGGGPSSCDSGTNVAALATPEAILVGAAAAVLVLVVAAAVAILVRYLPTITSGLLIVATIVLVWYLSSMYPEAARRLGARVLGALRRAATSIVDRVLRRHHPEVKSNCMS
jgi:hypothetical protein